MEPTYTFTQHDLVDAFRRWHADCEKHPQGGFVATTPDDPEAQAAILIDYLAPEAIAA